MNEQLLSMTDEELGDLLSVRFTSFEELSQEDRKTVINMVRGLLRRGLSLQVVWAGVDSAIGLLLDLGPVSQEGLCRPKACAFLAETPQARESTHHHLSLPNEARRAGREQLLKATASLLQEARSAKNRHEIRKLRQELLRIDQGYLRRALGKPAEDLCHQINHLLRQWASHF